ncbi:HdeD family acid-resistance protein [Agreia sp.]|uniref:HdeD family acid-resistance protein n=1 Tax=Agreia sp. TaxID=1872416 RepID=UPI0035BBB386
MTTQPTRPQAQSSYWGVPIARAIPAIVVALVVAFTPNHSSVVGLIVFGAFALASGLLTGILTLRALPAGTSRTLLLTQAVTSVVAGVLALALQGFGLGFLLYLVSVWGAITAILELVSGLRARGEAPAKDWIAMGALTGVLALAFLLLPLTDLVAVGLFGAYGAVLGIYLVIAGLSLRWGTETGASTANKSVTLEVQNP